MLPLALHIRNWNRCSQRDDVTESTDATNTHTKPTCHETDGAAVRCVRRALAAQLRNSRQSSFDRRHDLTHALERCASHTYISHTRQRASTPNHRRLRRQCKINIPPLYRRFSFHVRAPAYVHSILTHTETYTQPYRRLAQRTDNLHARRAAVSCTENTTRHTTSPTPSV